MAKTEIEFVEREIENLKIQFQRFSAHLESEQRVYGGTAKRVDLLEKLYESQQKLIDKLDQILRNGSGGLQLRVDRLEQSLQNNKANIAMLFGALGFLSQLADWVIKVISNTP